MDSIIVILLILAAVKFVFIGLILYFVFRTDVHEFWERRRAKPVEEPVPETPVCMYCASQYAHATGEVQTRWEGDELVMVTTFECDHCGFPIWRVERIPMGIAKR